MIMKKLPVAMITLFVLLILMSACTKKNNLTGDNWDGIKPLVTVDSTFTMGFSYTHEGKVSGIETHLVAGTAEGIEAMPVMQFTGLPNPDSVTFIGQPTLKIVSKRRAVAGANPLELSFFKLAQNWAIDSTSAILDANLAALTIPNVVVPVTYPATTDTSVVRMYTNVPISVLQNWQTTNVTGFNLAIKAVGSGWVELLSNEGLNGALLSFKYHENGDTTTVSYTSHPVKDSYRVTGTQTAVTNNVWRLKNLLPERLYVKFALPNSIFTHQDSTLSAADNILSDTDRKRMTINKAELILYVKDNPYYKNSSATFYAYDVEADTLSIPRVLSDSDVSDDLYLSTPSVTINDSSYVKIDITPLVQAYTSGDRQNHGVVVKINQEMQNFGSLEFWHFNDAPAGKKPLVRITYSVPFLKGN